MVPTDKSGEPEKTGTRALSVRLPAAEHDALKLFAFHTQASINDVVLRAVRSHLSREGRTKEFENLLKKSRDQYRDALDKLKDL